MKAALLALSVAGVATAGPFVAREVYSRSIAICWHGQRLDNYAQCPDCGRRSVQAPPGESNPERFCHGCGHTWTTKPAPGWLTWLGGE